MYYTDILLLQPPSFPAIRFHVPWFHVQGYHLYLSQGILTTNLNQELDGDFIQEPSNCKL